MEDQGAYASATYKNRFGSWTAALVEVFDDVTPPLSAREPPDGTRLTPGNSGSGPRVSEDDLLADLQALANDLGRSPTSKDMRKHGSHSTSTYMRRFESWSDALEAADLDPPDRNTITDDELIADLHRLGRSPSSSRSRWRSASNSSLDTCWVPPERSAGSRPAASRASAHDP